MAIGAQQKALSPPLKWAGGKRWLVPYLVPIWEQHKSRRLVEPFCGSIAVPLGLMPQRAILNDINPHLINFFKVLQDGLHVTIPQQYDKVLYYEHRERFNHLIREGKAES